jgi:hypothetical protein
MFLLKEKLLSITGNLHVPVAVSQKDITSLFVTRVSTVIFYRHPNWPQQATCFYIDFRNRDASGPCVWKFSPSKLNNKPVKFFNVYYQKMTAFRLAAGFRLSLKANFLLTATARSAPRTTQNRESWATSLEPQPSISKASHSSQCCAVERDSRNFISLSPILLYGALCIHRHNIGKC